MCVCVCVCVYVYVHVYLHTLLGICQFDITFSYIFAVQGILIL